MRTKRDLEEIELKVLAKYATKSVNSVGRKAVERDGTSNLADWNSKKIVIG